VLEATGRKIKSRNRKERIKRLPQQRKLSSLETLKHLLSTFSLVPEKKTLKATELAPKLSVLFESSPGLDR
jgi:hypothetical protein